MVWRIFVFIVVLSLASCKQVRQISDVFVAPSPRELYARNFAEDHFIYVKWGKSFESALKDSLEISLPYFEVGSFSAHDFPVYAYTAYLSRGEKLVVSFTAETDSVPVFVDIYKFRTVDSLPAESMVGEKRFGRLPLEVPIAETGKYRVLVQPELRQESDFQIEIYTLPTLVFPVAGVSDKAIQSFWGAPREAGARIHEGLDIFAPRLTPVLAVVDGRVSFAGERGLGGKQVWLREGLLKNSFYYAHLDSILVSPPEKVSKGDTLGFVGNTGNAITTAPHLHFGIYTGKGPIDPLPFIRRKDRKKTDLKVPADKGIVASAKANVRIGPDTEFKKLKTLTFRDTVTIMGRTADWYHTVLADTMRGYIHHTLIREIAEIGTSEISSNSLSPE